MLNAKERIDWARLPKPHRDALKRLGIAARNVFQGPDGELVLEYLRGQCFMQPAMAERPWEGAEQVVFRNSRMTLFQKIEFLLDVNNFIDTENKESRS